MILDLLKAYEKLPHREHQLLGVQRLVEREFFALFDEVGAGKTKQVVDASQILFKQGRIDTMLVITPGFARSTWAESDPLLGEVAKHAWDTVPNVIHEYHGDYTDLDLVPRALNWIVSNYEFIRKDTRLHDLLKQLRGHHTWLILDESWAIKGKSDQMRACRMLRYKRCDRVTILNGTPLSDGKPEDLYYPFMLLDREIIPVRNRTHFKSRYLIMGGYLGKQVVGYQNLDELNQAIAPHVLSRRTRDCWDLPPMLDPITVEARLTPATWKLYTSQRDDMVSWLGNQVSISEQAVVKGLRLAQICSGFLGGLETIDDDTEDKVNALTEPTAQPIPDWLRKAGGLPNESTPPVCSEAPAQAVPPAQLQARSTREIGREKLDAFLGWLKNFGPTPTKLLVWCRFRPELERTTRELGSVYSTVLNLKGKQSKADRAAAKALLAPGGDPRPGAVVGIQKAGGASLNFAAANIAVYLSNGPALIERTQSIGRIERPGATQPMLIVDVVACGPKGQKTMDHYILRSLKAKDDMARWTVDQWRKILAEE
jgi:hypothetical protein